MLWKCRTGQRKNEKAVGLQRLFKLGVADGARTHDNRNHNPGLYQLSYSHRKICIVSYETMRQLKKTIKALQL